MKKQACVKYETEKGTSLIESAETDKCKVQIFTCDRSQATELLLALADWLGGCALDGLLDDILRLVASHKHGPDAFAEFLNDSKLGGDDTWFVNADGRLDYHVMVVPEAERSL